MNADANQDWSSHTLDNLRAICGAMRDQGIHTITISYEGSGDSGAEEAPEAYDALNNRMLFNANQSVMRDHHWNDRAPSEVGFEDAIGLLLDDVLDDTGHSGYENNGGGGGELTINVTGTLNLNHYDYIVETIHEEHEVTIALEPMQSTAAAPAAA